MRPRFIVAELSKNWRRGVPYVDGPLISQLFETVINNNYARGYRLESFQLHRLQLADDELNETIVAVFERMEW